MISAFRRAGDFRGESAVTTWLHRIVVNASLDLLRRRSARSVGWSGDPDDLPLPEPRQGVDSAASTDSRLDVDAAMRTLPPPQRAALVLVDMLGYSVADASAILGVSEGTVKSRCARGPGQAAAPSGAPARRLSRRDGTRRSPTASHLSREEADERAVAPGMGGPGGGIPAGRSTSWTRKRRRGCPRLPRSWPSLPAPALPDAVEARISAALAAEAAARAAIGHGHGSATGRRSPPSPRRHGRAWDRAPGPSVRPGAAAAHAGRAPGRRRAGLGTAPGRAGASGCARAGGGRVAGGRPGGGRPRVTGCHGPAFRARPRQARPPGQAAASGRRVASSAAALGGGTGRRAAVAGRRHTLPAFLVSASGTRYQQATLAGQVRAQLAASGGRDAPPPGTVRRRRRSQRAVVRTSRCRGCAGACSTSRAARRPGSSTGPPTTECRRMSSLVPTHVWVVGLRLHGGQTRNSSRRCRWLARPGNLRALVSVEQ